MPTGWLIFLGLVNLYILFVWWLVRSGRMERWNLSLMLGFVLMVRTQRGKRTLEILSRPRWLWSAFGDAGIVLTLVGMAAMTLFMLALIPIVLDPGSGVEPLAANEILVIPGINPFVPLWYGILALIVTLVVHEGGHGVLALAHKMRVKSLGLLFAIVPIGAFVEPDEEDLRSSSRRKRLQVYAAGPTVNLVVAAIVLVGFAAAMGAAEPVDGTAIASIVGTPAQGAGLDPGDVIVEANGTSIPNWQAFTTFMANTTPGQTVNFTLRDGQVASATLTDRWSVLTTDDREAIFAEEPGAMAFCRQTLDPDPQTGGECAERLQEDAFLGIAPFLSDLEQERLADPVGRLTNFLFVISMPIGEVRGAPYLSFYLPTFFETPFAEELYWPMVNILFWVFWINLMVGLTNILPMLPLDGGHIFRDAVGGFVGRLRPKMDVERRDRLVGRAAAAVSLLIFGAFLLQIFGPHLVNVFA